MAEKAKPRESVFDVDVEKLAGVYAQAALDAAGDGDTEVLEDLQSVVSEVLDKFPEMEEIFGSALVSQGEKVGLIDRLLDSRVSTTTINFLKVLNKHDRLGLLRQVVRVAGQLWQERSNRVPVQLELAAAVDAKLQEEIAASLSKALDIEPVITTTINPALIAGFVARIGDKVYDASTRTTLERSRKAMVSRAIEAIVHHPEQFMDKSE